MVTILVTVNRIQYVNVMSEYYCQHDKNNSRKLRQKDFVNGGRNNCVIIHTVRESRISGSLYMHAISQYVLDLDMRKYYNAILVRSGNLQLGYPSLSYTSFLLIQYRVVEWKSCVFFI